MKKILLAFLVLTCTPLCALLSPLQQSIKEIDTIFKDERFSQLLGETSPIIEIEYSGNTYVFTTNDKQMVVEVEYLPSPKIGPQEFKLQFNEPSSMLE